MSSRAYKISLLGDWKSGRSTLLAALGGPPRPAHRGVTIARWNDPQSGCTAELWDVDSRSLLECLGQTFLSGADGLMVLCDLSRGQDSAFGYAVLQDAWQLVGERPSLILLNKRDLVNLQDVPGQIDQVPVMAVSAREPATLTQALSTLLRRLDR